MISCSTRKQRTMARSSTEAEYRAVTNTLAELVWLPSNMKEIGIPYFILTHLWCDNVGETYLSSNPIFHSQMKHVKIDFHFVRELMKQKILNVMIISRKDQISQTTLIRLIYVSMQQAFLCLKESISA